MLRLLKHLVGVLVVFVIAGCSGGGCSSGCSCGGVTPLAEGFDASRRIENAASVRLTDSGITFLEDNVGTLASMLLGSDGAGLTFEVPAFSQDLLIANAEFCPDGPNPNSDPPECIAEVDLASADLSVDPANPHNIHITGPLPFRIQSLPVRITWGWCPLCFDENLDIVLNDGKACPGDDQPHKDLALNVDISVEIDADQGHSRYGYSRVSFIDFSVSQDDILAGLEYCGGGLTPAILDALDGFLIGFLYDSLLGSLTVGIEEALCQQANPDLDPPCPTGTSNVDGVCRYGADSSAECASIILGMDGNIDLGALLASFSPGTRGAFDFLFAAGGHSVRTDGSGHHWGDLNPIDQGATLGMYGGTEPTPTSGCVPLADIELPTGIPIPDELVGNTLSDWPTEIDGPHFGLALSERFLNYALAQMYNSGALCLGITADALGDAVPLTTALIGLGLGLPEPKASMDELGWQKKAVPLAIVLRPQQPPHIEVGNGTDLATDPLLRLTMPQVSFDFYVWSLDRYIRAFTATMDLDVPVNLEVTEEGLVPVIEDLGVENATVTNSALLRKDPALIAIALQDLLGGLVGSFLGDALPAVDVNGLLADLGMELQIPLSDGGSSPGLRKLTKDSDDFLGLFATLAIAEPPDGQAAPTAASYEGAPSVTTAELVTLHVDPAGLTPASRTRDNGPRATLRLGSTLDDGRQAIEWQYKIDTQPWHPFTRERHLVVDDDWLRVQGRHVVKVRSRVVGDVHSLDPEPAEVVVIVDVDPPWVGVSETADGRWAVQVVDNVSGPDQVQVRLRLGWEDGDEIEWSEWSTWTPADGLAAVWPEDAEIIEVEATDEDGNIGTVTQELIRGRGAADGSGCECTLAPEPTGSRGWLGWLLGGTLGLGLWARRRRPSPRPKARPPRHPSSTLAGRGRKAATHGLAGLTLILLAGLPAGCSCEEDAEVAAGCRGRGDCEVLTPGLIGAYSSAAVAPDGTVWVAGYLEANWDLEVNLPWGDLVVGRLDGDEVAWKAIDGVPAEPAVDPELYDPKGFRGGQIEAGDDVGLWTSIAIDGAGKPGVAYYDATHAGLKYAHADGGWSTTVVQQPAELGDIGRYAKLLYVDGLPVIAYLFIEPGADGAIRSGVRVARGSSPSAGDAQWSLEDVAVNENSPCRAHLCPNNSECTAVEGLCAPESNDCDDCGSGEECVSLPGGAQCAAVYTSAKNDTYPDALGLYVSAALRPDGGIGLAFYDRVHGNVMVASQGGGGWTTLVVDGELGGENTGDKGVGTSLAIDDGGNFHLAYVDGLTEALNYQMVAGGATPGAAEIVDDGLGNPDGHHIVGDDANILVTQGGEIRISYQDASSGQLRLAVGTPSGEGHDWARNVIDQAGFAGAFSQQIVIGGAVQILNWWRVAAPPRTS
ncbi:MAG: hypothetical protein JRI68_05420 [Deltaproteobacteria bacterium]|nr:hypothetical protein [Deltaproteobacteria bacterium]